MRKRLDLVGQIFGRLTVIEFTRMIDNDSHFLCKCECGNSKEIRGRNLTQGSTKSCGCLLKEIDRKIHTIHGMVGSPEYRAYGHMCERCNNPKCKEYKNYGARGITVCDRWSEKNGFIHFINDMGHKPAPKYSLDRIDNNGPYSPDNCQWATAAQQNNNYRQNLMIEINGVTKNATQWAKIYSISRDVIYNRITIGWNSVDAVKTPLYHKPLRK